MKTPIPGRKTSRITKTISSINTAQPANDPLIQQVFETKRQKPRSDFDELIRAQY